MNSTKQNRVDSGISNPVNLLTKRTADFTSISKPITTILTAYYAVLTGVTGYFGRLKFGLADVLFLVILQICLLKFWG